MKADIYISRFHEEAFGGILNELKQVSGRALNESHIVIVPDRYTLCVEKLLCGGLQASGAFNISVQTFRRLASHIENLKYISASGAVMITAKAVNDVRKNLECYRRSAEHYGFAKSVYEEIRRYKSHNIEPQQLFEAAEKQNGDISIRLSDIAKIYHRYNELTESRYTDNEGCCKIIALNAENPFIRKSRFYICGYDFFSKAEQYCIEKIAKNALKISFAVTYSECFDTAKQILKNAGKDCGIKEIRHNRSGLTDFIYNNINSYKVNAPYRTNLYSLNMFQDAAAEAEHAAQGIASAVRQEKLRYRDICVVLSDISAYIYPLDKIFKMYGIPFYISESVLLSGEPLFKTLYSLICAAADGCEFTDVNTFVKSGYIEGDIDEFENYCRMYGISYKRFLQPFTLGETDFFTKAEDVRKKFEDYYYMLPEGLCKCSGFTQSARKIINAFNAEDVSRRQINGLKNIGYSDEAVYRGQTLSKLNRLFDEIDEIFGEEEITLKQFKELLFTGADSIRLSVIPVSADAVNCGGFDLPRYIGSKKIFILGANEGVFPDTAFPLSMVPYSDMKGAGLELTEGALQLKRERERIRNLLCQDAGYSLSCRAVSDEGKELRQSEYFIKLKTFLGLNINSHLIYFLKKEKYTLKGVSSRLSSAPKLFFKDKKTSVSALETYFACPRKFLYRYGIYALPRKESELKSLDKGNFLHAAAEMFLKKYNESSNVNMLAEECYQSVIEREEFRRFLSDTLQAAQLNRLKDEIVRVCNALSQQLSFSRFKPAFLEAEFDEGKEFPLIDMETSYGKLYLKGKIDRADIFEGEKKYIRVIDYKSGSVKYDEKSLYFGNKVQLFIYIYALEKSGYCPAGVYYFPITDSYSGEGENIYRLNGVTVNDSQVLEASDSNINSGSSEVLKIKLSQGENGFKDNANLYSGESFEKRVKYAVKLCKNAAEEILGGNISVSPVKDVCGYCDYRCVCAFDLDNAAVRKQNLRSAAQLIEEAADELN